MSRNRKTAFEDLIEIASAMSWWLNLLLACIAYLVFHQIASIDFSNPSVITPLAGITQYLAPLLFVMGAGFSAIKQWKRKSVFDKQKDIDTIRQLSWQSFEYLVSEACRRKGYTVTETPDGPDGGIDLILKKDKRLFLVQCKHWRAKKVSVKEVRELKGVVAGQEAYGGILVTSGLFTSDAVEEANRLNIELVDAVKLATLIPQMETTDLGTESIPNCPKCGSEMTIRTAKQGSNAGRNFWGCSTFPKCRASISKKC